MTNGFTNYDRALLYRILAGQEEALGMMADQAVTLSGITQQEINLATDLTQLTADVANDTTVDQSAVTLIQGLSGMLATAIAALPDPTQLQSLQTQLETNAAALAAAVAAGTPAAPPPPPGP